VPARTPSPRSQLRELLAGPDVVVAPGAINALFAMLVEEAGFPAVYMTGAGVAQGVLGLPDLGLATLTEMAQQVSTIAGAITVPLIADADTGFGGVLNVQRTVRLYESAGAAAIQLEDQTIPKRCGHFDGKEVVETDEMCARLRAAVDARMDPDLVLIARTDARAVLGLDAAIERAHAYVEAGADVLFVEAPESPAELERIGRELGHAPLLANMVEGGKTPQLPVAELGSLGFKIVIFPGLLTRVAVHACRSALEVLRQEGDSRPLADRIATFQEVNEIVGLAGLEEQARQLEPLRPVRPPLPARQGGQARER
jgi:methylisocitrate lyase